MLHGSCIYLRGRFTVRKRCIVGSFRLFYKCFDCFSQSTCEFSHSIICFLLTFISVENWVVRRRCVAVVNASYLNNGHISRQFITLFRHTMHACYTYVQSLNIELSIWAKPSVSHTSRLQK